MTGALMRLGIATLMTCVLGATGIAPTASADQPSWPPVPPACGTDADGGILWDAAKNAQAGEDVKAHGNLDVEIPGGDRSRGYVVHHGKSYTKNAPYDLLFIPTVRVSGIECYNLLSPNTPHFFKAAYDEKMWLPINSDWAAGINGQFRRDQNQLHIHISKLTASARKQIDDFASRGLPTDASEWYSQKALVRIDGHMYRAWNPSTLDHNFFSLTSDFIVRRIGKIGISMADETLLITQFHPGSGGFIVLNSDTISGLDNGTNNSDFMLDRDAT
ncbi:CDP-diacylglycerol diphosphatase [Mycobacterium sp. Aquia_213]|uniref:CDP-diacylglycerol diphosphatase n=1 Tax=Mycobacterium sp. Aquia_213 TaxID=2991728 RepID=UPI00227141F4|nr:CDP-diacylglycerol diphosphatase [Mycobacterium sp. Aquia_213]WAC90630.1 CDP-diacylglycerol diphosphatase [Mycobacterium sp. Aquia_213]